MIRSQATRCVLLIRSQATNTVLNTAIPLHHSLPPPSCRAAMPRKIPYQTGGNARQIFQKAFSQTRLAQGPALRGRTKRPRKHASLPLKLTRDFPETTKIVRKRILKIRELHQNAAACMKMRPLASTSRSTRQCAQLTKLTKTPSNYPFLQLIFTPVLPGTTKSTKQQLLKIHDVHKDAK